MLVGLVKDESSKYDGFDWHDAYAEEFRKIGIETIFLDFKKNDWLEQISENIDCIMWRAWHVPQDRDNAKDKIYFLDRILNIPIFPNWDMYWPYDNKIRQAYLMRKSGFPMPNTFISYSKEEAIGYANHAKYPIISKSSTGACADEVRKIDDRKSLKYHIDKIFSEQGLETHFPWIRQKGYVYLQEFLPTERDIRVITIGDKVELAFWRESDSWKKNISKGGRMNPYGIPEESRRVSIDIAKKLNFHWCAFDMIQHEGKMYVLEFSSIFGFSSSEQCQKYFGSPNAHIFRKQAEYIAKTWENKKCQE